MGDIHGQLADLVHLMNHNGLPSETNKYIFNGDFVDRGVQGVEVRVRSWYGSRCRVSSTAPVLSCCARALSLF